LRSLRHCRRIEWKTSGLVHRLAKGTSLRGTPERLGEQFIFVMSLEGGFCLSPSGRVYDQKSLAGRFERCGFKRLIKKRGIDVDSAARCSTNN